MTTIKRNKLNTLYSRLAPGRPVTSEDLAALGISADLAVHYVRAGWLIRLARGVFARPADTLLLNSTLCVLERKLLGLHVGGKTALEWHGIRHYISQQSKLHLYGWTTARLPDWFLQQFPSEYHRKRLFNEQPDALLYVSRLEARDDTPLVSSPERAVLELLSEVGIRQPLSEAREIMESTHTLRVKVLTALLKKCSNVKTVRLCLQLGQELSLP